MKWVAGSTWSHKGKFLNNSTKKLAFALTGFGEQRRKKMYENRVRAREYDSPKIVYGFLGTAGFVSWLVCLAIASLFLTGCKNGGAPTTPPPPPNQDQYEPLGTVHYINDSQGNYTGVWVRLMTINPPRGSTVRSRDEVNVTVEMGTLNKGGAMVHFSWNSDGSSRDDEPNKSFGVEEKKTRIGTMHHWVSSPSTLRFLIAKTSGSRMGDPIRGQTSFLIDYR